MIVPLRPIGEGTAGGDLNLIFGAANVGFPIVDPAAPHIAAIAETMRA